MKVTKDFGGDITKVWEREEEGKGSEDTIEVCFYIVLPSFF